MRRVAFGAICVVGGLAWTGSRDQALNLDFERGLRDWTATGEAFDGQPIEASTLERDTIVVPRELLKLGGDYWRGARYPIGASQEHLVRSSDRAEGTVTSGVFTIGADARYFTARVGGANDAEHEKVELEARGAGSSSSGTNEGFRVVARFTGLGVDRLHRETVAIPDSLRGLPMRIKLIDSSTAPGEHLMVDDLQFTASPPPPIQAPLWGLADVHTHPMNYMGFGALEKDPIRSIWGVAGGSYSDYANNPALISRDIPSCIPGHGGGPASEFFIDVSEGRFHPEVFDWITGHFSTATFRGDQMSHQHKGARSFSAFPSFKMGTHYQMHITQIHRAWEGGLRLMVALVIDNKGVEFFMSPSSIRTLVPDTVVLKAQICGMRQMVELNSDWMEIAYSPADVRRIVGANRLAVVLGIEMDQLGQMVDTTMKAGRADSAAFDREIESLWNLGIRQVTPIHAINNLIGGAAVFQPAYNYLNDFMNRGKAIVRDTDLPKYEQKFFKAHEAGCGKSASGPIGQCVAYRMSTQQIRPALVRGPQTGEALAPFLVPVNDSDYRQINGMMNDAGLTADGKYYIGKLMQHGMIVGIEHMSQKSVDDFYSVIVGELEKNKHFDCRGFGLQPVPHDCYANAYPVYMSHGSLRALHLTDRSKTMNEDLMASEYQLSDRDASVIDSTGGMLGQFVTELPVIPPPGFSLPPGLENNCGGSSKSLATSLLYAMTRVGSNHVGLATDFTIIPGVSPRFGDDACHSYKTAYHPSIERRKMPEQYATKKQADGVVYDYYTQQQPPDRVTLGNNVPLAAYTMDRRRRPFDVNVDGFAHYGLLPDVLQDVRNDGTPKEALDALFSSVESYVEMWEKIGRVMNVDYPNSFKPAALACTEACHGLCPEDPNAGAPRPSSFWRR